MSSILDKSLDEILSSKPKKNFKKKAPVAKSKVTKAVVKKPVAKKAGAPAKPTKASATVLDASYATKVMVYNLPKDIKQDAVKDFFASQIGGVANVSLHFNEKGQSKGVATVNFRNSSSANKAVEKYNGAPIDNGSLKLRLELIIDPSKKPLSTRIVANSGKKETPKKVDNKNKNKGKVQDKKPQQKTDKQKKKRPQKKTVEQLDQEMADYFEKKE